jgi:hypothetical protein
VYPPPSSPKAPLSGRLAPPLVDNPGSKIAPGLLGCSEWGQLSDLYGLNANAKRTPTAANARVFRQLVSKINRSAVRNFERQGRDTASASFEQLTPKKFV